VTQPVGQTNFLGGSTLFQVAATSGTALRYQWRFNGADLPNATNSMLALSNLTFGQTGDYSVRVNNNAGSVLSSLVHLEVSGVAEWRDAQTFYPTPLPLGLTNVVAVAAGVQLDSTGADPPPSHSLALKATGEVIAWGGSNTFGELNVPAGLNAVAISGGGHHSLALRADGSVVAWGANDLGQASVPAGLNGVVAVAAGGAHSLALRSDGTVTGWGVAYAAVPPIGLSNVVAIAAGDARSFALKANGTVVAWGTGSVAQVSPPSALSNVVAIAAGQRSMALTADGRVWQWNPTTFILLPQSNVVAIADGALSRSLALMADGTVRIWSDFFGMITNVSPDLQNVVAIAAGSQQSLALVGDGSPRFYNGRPENRSVSAGRGTRFSAMVLGAPPLVYQWRFNGTDIPGATSAVLTLADLAPANAGTYSLLVSNAVGMASNTVANLTVLTDFTIVSQPQSRTLTAGFPVSFHVGLDGALTVSYQWRFNGVGIAGASNSVFSLPGIGLSDAGRYDVVISSPFSVSILSEPAVLTVLTSNVPTGLFTADFNSGPTPGTSLYGVAALGAAEAGRSGVLKLMTNVQGAFSDFLIDDFSGGAGVTAFIASFDLLLGGGTTRPADGFSFNFGTNYILTPGYLGPPLREEGYTNGLSVSFDTWDNGTEYEPDDTAPAIEVKVFGRRIAFQSMAGMRAGRPPAGPLLTDPQTGQALGLETEPPVGQGPLTHFAPATVELKFDGTVWVTYKGVLVISNVQALLPPISGGKFLFGARTGGAYENMWIDDLGIQTTSDPKPVAFVSEGPTNQFVREGQQATFQAGVFGSSPSIQWFSNDVAIAGATAATYTTPAVTFANNGDVYRIEVTNAISSTNRSATLAVLVPPVIVTPPQSQIVIAGDNVTFTVTVTNNATLPINYQWRKIAVLTNILLNSRSCSFTLFNVSTNFTTTNGPGGYRVVVTNLAFPPPSTSVFTNTVLPATAPTATTLTASDFTPFRATLSASVNAMGAFTTSWFEFGLTTAYGSTTSATNAGNAAAPVPFTQSAGSLLPHTYYHYRVVATNYGGISVGQDMSFQTAEELTPSIITGFGFLANGRFRLLFDGHVGAGYDVQISADLFNWTTLGPGTEITPGHFEFIDPNAPSDLSRFYRLKSP